MTTFLSTRNNMRDGNILKNYKKEINLQTKIIKDKKKYSRKKKHKKNVG